MDVDLIGWVDVGLGGTYSCRCGILYAPMLGIVFYARLVSLTSPRGLGTLYKTILAESCQNLKMTAIDRNM